MSSNLDKINLNLDASESPDKPDVSPQVESLDLSAQNSQAPKEEAEDNMELKVKEIIEKQLQAALGHIKMKEDCLVRQSAPCEALGHSLKEIEKCPVNERY